MNRLSFVVLCGLIMGWLLLIPRGDAQATTAEEGAVAGGVALPETTGDSLDGAKPRDPFWPVGYAPKKVQKTTGKNPGKTSLTEPSAPESMRVPLWEEARKKVDIRGISLVHDKDSGAPKFLALVSGRVVETGNVVSVKYLGRLYRWRVVGISEEGVSFQKLDVRGE
ncbi:MAG: hypothetical protein WCS52_18090 [bacterium]